MKKITKDLTEAMKAKDAFTVSVLRMLKSTLKNEEINKKDTLTDEEVLSIIKKQVKTRKDSKVEYENYNRLDIAENLGKEIQLLNKYLPEELSEEELIKIINEVIAELNPDGIKGMGVVVKTVKEKVGTRADMGFVSKIVKEKLMNL